MKYHLKGIDKKTLNKQRRKPLPLGLMNDKFKGLRIIRRRDIEDKINSENIQCKENNNRE